MGYVAASIGLREDIAFVTGFVVETGIFCAYTCLFMAALPVLTNARRLKDEHSANAAWVFLICSILMYLIATIYLVVAGFLFYRSLFLNTDAPKGNTSYLQDFTQWELLALPILGFVQTWLGDTLMIYRCYIVWDNNIWLISIPVCLLLAATGINLSVLNWFRDPSSIAPALGSGLFTCIYPLAFVQNFLTTGLIILRIFLQHRSSKKAGVRNVGSKLTLMRILRIIVESAAIYTIQILVLTVLYFRGDNFQFVVQPATIPSIGITFVLLALRIEASRRESAPTTKDLRIGIRSAIIPQWLRGPDREAGSEDSQNVGSLPAGSDGTALTEQKISVLPGDSGTESIQWDPEFSSNSATRPKVDENAY